MVDKEEKETSTESIEFAIPNIFVMNMESSTMKPKQMIDMIIQTYEYLMGKTEDSDGGYSITQ